jgi:nucleotide-binding universal stress UspA family protein
MFSLRRILVPIDFSERSHTAVRYAEALARRFQAHLTLLHVLPPPHYEFTALEAGGAVLDDLFAARTQYAQKELDSFLADELAGQDVERVLSEGDPARQIVETARTSEASVVLMPTHGYGTFRRFILGSVTAKVLHDAECPVWTGVHIESAPQMQVLELRRILVAVDLGSQSAKAIAWGREIASTYGAKLSVVHAIPCSDRPSRDPLDASWHDQFLVEVRERIRALGAPEGTEIAIETGDAPAAVCRHATASEADLLVIARGSAAGAFGRLRTNAYAIIRESPCPVVSV